MLPRNSLEPDRLTRTLSDCCAQSAKFWAFIKEFSWRPLHRFRSLLSFARRPAARSTEQVRCHNGNATSHGVFDTEPMASSSASLGAAVPRVEVYDAIAPTGLPAGSPWAVSEKPHANQLTNLLTTFAECPRCFTATESRVFTDADYPISTLEDCFTEDPRFVRLSAPDSSDVHFATKPTLFRWFSQLSCRLADIGQTKLSQRQLALAASLLRPDGRWEAPPEQLVEYGSKWGFIRPATYSTGSYLFPLVWPLQSLPGAWRPMLFEALAHGESREASPPDIRYENLFSWCKDRTLYVILTREGILTGERQTLKQIANKLGVSRERVRQIEQRFWKLVKHHRHSEKALTPILEYIVWHKCSLIVDMKSSEFLPLLFLCKCAGFRAATLDNLSLMVISGPESLDDLLVSNGDVEATLIEAYLETEEALPLTEEDTRVLATRIAEFRRKQLTKAERVYLALRTIGRPAHYSEVAQVHN